MGREERKSITRRGGKGGGKDGISSSGSSGKRKKKITKERKGKKRVIWAFFKTLSRLKEAPYAKQGEKGKETIEERKEEEREDH